MVSMEHTVLPVVAAVLLLLHPRQELLAAAAAKEGGNNNSSSIHGGLLAVDASYSQIMHLVQDHHARRFSYCLHRSDLPRHGSLRFDGEVPSTAGMPRMQLLYNAEHAADYGPYFVQLAAVSVAGTLLRGINADTFRRNEADGSGGTVLDVGTPMLIMVREAYDILEHAVAEHLRPLGLRRVHRPGYTFCLRGATRETQRHIPLVKLIFEEPGAEVWLSASKLFTISGGHHDLCLLARPGDRTVIGAYAQVDWRFTFDIDANAVFHRFETCSRDTGHSISSPLD